MPTITVHLTDEEKSLITNYVEIIGENLNDFMKEVTLDSIADHYDIEWLNEHGEELYNQPTMTFEEMCKDLGITLPTR